MSKFSNWFNKQADKQYTLGDAIFGKGSGYELSNGERAIERAFTIGGILAAGVALLTGGVAEAQLALDMVVTGKALGLVGGAFAKVATRGIQFTPAEPALIPIRVETRRPPTSRY